MTRFPVEGGDLFITNSTTTSTSSLSGDTTNITVTPGLLFLQQRIIYQPPPDAGGNPFTYIEYDSAREQNSMTSGSPARVIVTILCKPGSYLSQGSNRCELCPAGTFSADFSLVTVCQPCLVQQHAPQGNYTIPFSCVCLRSRVHS